ncbi:hypothetical protein [Streptomyces qinglanensis]|uniref:Uncharacterized protein n=1 Tax=Streptomyces qinglanensis TaxID=943816 RepID=A0A1H9URR8_9ACTN|nr:hypothetical protein [Streptomyces qinglanensis]SES12048.1 hypothetical protein SAMN05421870_10981 [Streptomyces qinglanensis]
MAALAWLLIPLVAAVATSMWGSWAGRRRVKTPDAAGVAGYERFRVAMERSRADDAPDGPTAPADEPEARRDLRWWRRKGGLELASTGAAARTTPDGPAREAG